VGIQYTFKRYEKKYLLTRAQYRALYERIASAVVEDSYGKSTICNLYYDTDDYKLIRASLEKPVYKEKLRVRSYGVPQTDSDLFVEIKKKYQGVVYKRRIKLPVQTADDFLLHGKMPENAGQIAKEIAWMMHTNPLKPKVLLAYDRLALYAKADSSLRITFDENIRFRTDQLDLCKGAYGTQLLAPNTILMEIKIPGSMPLWLCEILSDLQIYPTSFSKYGFCYQQYILPTINQGVFICA
jgi:SPX domain protein involved in polyphosphate accumulation